MGASPESGCLTAPGSDSVPGTMAPSNGRPRHAPRTNPDDTAALFILQGEIAYMDHSVEMPSASRRVGRASGEAHRPPQGRGGPRPRLDPPDTEAFRQSKILSIPLTKPVPAHPEAPPVYNPFSRQADPLKRVTTNRPRPGFRQSPGRSKIHHSGHPTADPA